MSEYIVISKPNCPQCEQAKNLLSQHNLQFDVHMFDVGQPKEADTTYVDVAQFKQQYPTAASAPQIFRGNTHVGGLQQLRKLLTTS